MAQISLQHAESGVESDQGRDANNPAKEHSKTVANLKGFFFYLWTFTLALPLFAIMLIQAPFVMLIDKFRCLSSIPLSYCTWGSFNKCVP